MFAFLGSLFGKTKRTTKSYTFKPSLDVLESRQVMSVSSAAIHAVAPPTAGAPADVFYFDSRHRLALNGEELPQNVRNTPNAIQTFSAGLDVIGDPEVVAKAGDGSLWKWNEGDWTKILSASKGATSFAAVDGGRVYAIYGNGSLHEFNANNSGAWNLVPGSTKVTAIDAVTDGRGNDAVFAQLANGNFGEYFGGHFDLMLAAGTRLGSFPVSVGTFTAATDQFGDGVVYATLLGARVGRFRIDFGLYHIGYGSETFITNDVRSFSGGTDALWINGSDGNLYEYNGSTLTSEPRDGSAFASISAVNANNVFYVASGTLEETQLSPVFGVTSYEDYGTVNQ